MASNRNTCMMAAVVRPFPHEVRKVIIHRLAIEVGITMMGDKLRFASILSTFKCQTIYHFFRFRLTREINVRSGMEMKTHSGEWMCRLGQRQQKYIICNLLVQHSCRLPSHTLNEFEFGFELNLLCVTCLRVNYLNKCVGGLRLLHFIHILMEPLLFERSEAKHLKIYHFL